MEIGMYLRNVYGGIGKIIECPDNLKDAYNGYLWVQIGYEQSPINEDKIVKASQKIKDLIEEDDVIEYEFYGIDSICKVIKSNDTLGVGWDEDGDFISLDDIDIKSFMTSEDFEDNKYKFVNNKELEEI